MMLASTDATTLALLYHLNSRVWTNAEAYADPSNEPRYDEAGADALALAKPSDGSTLASLIAERRSCRAFERSALDAATVGALLHDAYGITGLERSGPAWARFRRAVPSAGGLYPLDVFVVLERVRDAADGLYRYVPLSHALEPVEGGAPAATIRSHLLQPEVTADANVLVFFTAEFARTLTKYGPRGYRYVLLECGHAAQNLCLAAVEHGLETLCLGGFDDDAVNRDLGLDGSSRAVFYAVALGAPLR